MSGCHTLFDKCSEEAVNVWRRLGKLTFHRIKYKKGEGYDAEAYWRDRFTRYNLSLKGAGNESRSEEENARQYECAKDELISLLESSKVDLRDKRVLEVGAGTGFYTGIFSGQARSYTAVDITDTLFEELSRAFPGVRQVKADICSQPIEGQYDIVLMIDVLEHIVTEGDLRGAFDNIKRCLSPGGRFVLGPVADRSRRHLFYVRFWDQKDVREYFPGYGIEVCRPFRQGSLMIISTRL
jgi:SAM-dependent methyltransferase